MLYSSISSAKTALPGGPVEVIPEVLVKEYTPNVTLY